MIKIEKTDVYGWEAAIRGMRNPMNSWDKGDSSWDGFGDADGFTIGDNDLDLMMRLASAGSVHAKYRRMITVTVDITAPLYWWKEFDTYKVGTVANSTSTMHKIHSKPFEREDFSCDRLDEGGLCLLDAIIDYLEEQRLAFCEDKTNRQPWHNMIQLLPSSYNQMRTVTMNYENLINIYYARKTHKLAEWHTMCDWISELPYAADIIKIKDKKDEE